MKGAQGPGCRPCSASPAPGRPAVQGTGSLPARADPHAQMRKQHSHPAPLGRTGLTSKARGHPSPSPRRQSPHLCDRFISLATLWDMATAATRRGSVMPMMLSSLGEGEHDGRISGNQARLSIPKPPTVPRQDSACGAAISAGGTGRAPDKAPPNSTRERPAGQHTDASAVAAR